MSDHDCRRNCDDGQKHISCHVVLEALIVTTKPSSFVHSKKESPKFSSLDIQALFTMAPPHLAHRAALSRGRIGRGGRLIFDRMPWGPRFPKELRDPNLSLPHGLTREVRPLKSP
eukprot:COSAG04_NODE_1754_length_5687_cov_2.326593_1_plen_114_part_10